MVVGFGVFVCFGKGLFATGKYYYCVPRVSDVTRLSNAVFFPFF